MLFNYKPLSLHLKHYPHTIKFQSLNLSFPVHNFWMAKGKKKITTIQNTIADLTELIYRYRASLKRQMENSRYDFSLIPFVHRNTGKRYCLLLYCHAYFNYYGRLFLLIHILLSFWAQKNEKSDLILNLYTFLIVQMVTC